MHLFLEVFLASVEVSWYCTPVGQLPRAVIGFNVQVPYITQRVSCLESFMPTLVAIYLTAVHVIAVFDFLREEQASAARLRICVSQKN